MVHLLIVTCIFPYLHLFILGYRWPTHHSPSIKHEVSFTTLWELRQAATQVCIYQGKLYFYCILKARDWNPWVLLVLFILSHNCSSMCRISGKILEFEMVTQTEATRRRYRYLSHFSLTTSFKVCSFFNFLEQLLQAKNLLFLIFPP